MKPSTGPPLLLLVIFVGVVAWYLAQALRHGRIAYAHVFFTPYYFRRDTQPIAFWVVFVLYGGTLVGALITLVLGVSPGVRR